MTPDKSPSVLQTAMPFGYATAERDAYRGPNPDPEGARSPSTRESVLTGNWQVPIARG
jgi:hypothetical protein